MVQDSEFVRWSSAFLDCLCLQSRKDVSCSFISSSIPSQLANTIQADIGQMPSSRYRHIGPMQVADIGPSGFAPWANVDSASAPHRQTQQPSSGPMMGRCLAFLNRPNTGPTSARDRQTHQPSIGPMMG